METIFINGRFLGRQMTGVDRFAYELVYQIDQMIAMNHDMVTGLRFCILIPPRTDLVRSFLHIPLKVVGTLAGQLWEQIDLPRAARRGLLVNLCNTAPVCKRNQLVVIHDAATVSVPMAFGRAFRWWYRLLMPILGRVARRVLTVSAFSRAELVKGFYIPEHKISVISESGDHILRVPTDHNAIERFGLGERPYVLVVSSNSVHKNFRLVLDAIARMSYANVDIAIAGGTNAKVFRDVSHLESSRVYWLGYVSDAELRALYESALCFVFPSIYEGFGIPPLEAMCCGCPVLASSSAAIPEVCGDAAEYFDPFDAGSLARVLTRVATDSEVRESLVNRAKARASTFSWEEAGRNFIAVCREAIG